MFFSSRIWEVEKQDPNTTREDNESVNLDPSNNFVVQPCKIATI
jgi:hypothetical protein